MAVPIVPVRDGTVQVQSFANVAESSAQAKAVKVKVVKETTGPVNFLQNLAGYYKTLIALVSGILVVANEITPVLDFIPGQYKQYVTTAIVFVGAVLTFLKSNEHWVDSL